MVAAGPGSGETHTLVAKFLELVDSDVKPERILTLTFSTKATAEMRHRTVEATPRSHRVLWISTFHTFGHALVERYALESGIPRSYRLH